MVNINPLVIQHTTHDLTERFPHTFERLYTLKGISNHTATAYGCSGLLLVFTVDL